MADRLDVVSVGIKHECAVVVRVVVRPQAGRAIVLAAGRKRRTIKCVNRGAVFGSDRNVQRTVGPALRSDPEIWLAAGAEAGSGVFAFGLVRTDLHD